MTDGEGPLCRLSRRIWHHQETNEALEFGLLRLDGVGMVIVSVAAHVVGSDRIRQGAGTVCRDRSEADSASHDAGREE